MESIESINTGLESFQVFCNDLICPEEIYAMESITLKNIPAKVKSVFETIGRLIKTLIEKIKSFFSKKQTFQMPYNVYKEGIELDSFIQKEITKAMMFKEPDMDTVFKRCNALRTSKSRIGSGGKPVTISEGTIIQKARNIQDTYNKVITKLNELNGTRTFTDTMGSKVNQAMNSLTTVAKLLQHRIGIYTYFMTYFNEKATVESLLVLQ